MSEPTTPPDATTLHDPSPDRLRRLLEGRGLTLSEAALRCGVSLRTMERYLSPSALERGNWIPYPLQFTLEALCLARPEKEPPP